MSEHLTIHGFPSDWTKEYNQRLRDAETTATWQHEEGRPLTENEQAQASDGLARARQEFTESITPSERSDKGEDDD